jgi:hypothetical protein
MTSLFLSRPGVPLEKWNRRDVTIRTPFNEDLFLSDKSGNLISDDQRADISLKIQ